MNKLLSLVLAATFMGNAVAEEKEREDKLTLSLSTQVWSKYLFNSGLVFHDDPVVQTNAFLQLPHGVYVNLWWSVGLNDSQLSSDFADEVDFTVGWSGTIDQQKKLTLDIGASYFDLFPLGEQGGDGDVVKPYANLGYGFDAGENHSMTALLAAEWHQPLEDMGSGAYVWIGLKDAWTISPHVSLTGETGILYDSGAYSFEPSWVSYTDIELSWQLSPRVSFQLPSIKLTTPLNNNPDRKTEHVWGFGMSVDF